MRRIATCLLLCAAALSASPSAADSSRTHVRMTRQEGALTGRETGDLRIALTEHGSTLRLRLVGLQPNHPHAISVGYSSTGNIVARFVPSATGRASLRVALVGPSDEIRPAYDPRDAYVFVSTYEGAAVLMATPFVEKEASPPGTPMRVVATEAAYWGGPETARITYTRSREGREAVRFDLAGLTPGPHALSFEGYGAEVVATESGTARIVLRPELSEISHPEPHILRGPLRTPPLNAISVHDNAVLLFEGFLYSQIPGINYCAPVSRTASLEPEPGRVGAATVTMMRLDSCAVLLELSLEGVTPANYGAQIGLDGFGGGIVSDDGSGVGSLVIPFSLYDDIRTGSPIVVSTLDAGIPTPAFSGVLP